MVVEVNMVAVAKAIETPTAQQQGERWHFSVADYHRMAEIGILNEDDRLELIDGEIRLMSPIGLAHAAIVKRYNALLSPQLGKLAIVSIQDPVELSSDTEPEPDIVLLRYREDFYAHAAPKP